MAPRLSRANLHLLCSQPLQLLTNLGVRETFTSLEVFTQRNPQDSASRASWTSSARPQTCSYSRARALTASPLSRVANNRPRFQHSASPHHPRPLLGIPPPFSAAPLSWIPLGSPPAAKLGSDLPASLGLPSSLEPPANPLSPLLAPVVGKGPSLTSLLSASPPLGPRGLVTSW